MPAPQNTPDSAIPSAPPSRPVLLIALTVIVALEAILVVVLAVFQTMGELNGLDMRERLTRALGNGSGEDLGLTVDEAITVMRWSLYVAGVAAAASAILGVYALRRDRTARVGLTVAAVPIVLSSSRVLVNPSSRQRRADNAISSASISGSANPSASTLIW